MTGPDACVDHPLPPDAAGKARNHPGNLLRIHAAAAASLGEEPNRFAARIAGNFRRWMGGGSPDPTLRKSFQIQDW